MSFDELFTRAVALLPGPVRERLDGDFPLDWTVLEDAAIGAELAEAVNARRRLPQAVENLAHRLIRDIGIVPGDVASGIERTGMASAWIHWVTIEADGESYQLRNDRSGDVHTGVHPEAVAGYAALGMDLVTMLHDTVERWLEAGHHYRRTAKEARELPGQCAVRIHAHLQAQPETISGHRTAASLARTLEYAWNTQSFEVRAALSGLRFSTARGARAPRRSYLAPVTGYRLNACDPGEIRWLRALAERAATGAGTGPTRATTREARVSGQGLGKASDDAARDGGSAGGSASETGQNASTEPALELGSDPEERMPATELAELERAANRLSGTVRRRLSETYGTEIAEAADRLQSSREVGALRAVLEPGASGPAAPAPPWLGELAGALLMDAGAQTRGGARTARMQLEPGPQPDHRHRATEVETGATGHLTPYGLVEQIRLGLGYAHDAWVGLSALRNAGKEGEWALNEAQSTSSRLSAEERETLETARDIGLALGRAQRSGGRKRGDRLPSALDQAAMAAETLKTVGPTIRTAAGWPGSAPAPNPRMPEDVARMATVAEALHGEIRSIANRLIAGWVADVQAYGEGRNS